MVQLEIQKLTVAYGENRPAVDDVSLTVPAGAARALIGASGAGKSTIGSAALGLLAPSASVRGRVLVDGIEKLGRGPAARGRRARARAPTGIGYAGGDRPYRLSGVPLGDREGHGSAMSVRWGG
ncbi:MAG: ATP-binding cassette domain-containing protein, partial [Myxococcota bacterium]